MIKILPALPARWTRGEVQNWCIQGGTLSFAWNRKTGSFQAELTARHRIATKLQLPGWICKLNISKEFNTKSIENGTFQLHLEAGEKWSVDMRSV
ncbi:glycoside hydrolase family 95-like protein [Paenibacillus xylanilyticus]|uniref:glycoside hydrolase family 95-like protein n=1 Tax=Paenibacillus xylanilyticus TaxID=248903 RepID=UPI001FECD3FC|nr:hypothetical protein [Paenibacillus xylanilyticus]